MRGNSSKKYHAENPESLTGLPEKTERGLLDFDDLLLCTAEKIRNGDVKEGWEKRFRYLLVDEFQDINPAQLELVRLWAEAGRISADEPVRPSCLVWDRNGPARGTAAAGH